jgi:urease accessory protein UreE
MTMILETIGNTRLESKKSKNPQPNTAIHLVSKDRELVRQKIAADHIHTMMLLLTNLFGFVKLIGIF